jgi:anti-sigma B factor antagonist
MSVVEFKASVSSAPALSVVIALEGEIDMASAPMLADLIDTGFQVGKPTVVLEMSGVTFLDSQGLGTLLRAERRARDARDALVLRSRPSAFVTC